MTHSDSSPITWSLEQATFWYSVISMWYYKEQFAGLDRANLFSTNQNTDIKKWNTVKCQKVEINSSIQTLRLEKVFEPEFLFGFRFKVSLILILIIVYRKSSSCQCCGSSCTKKKDIWRQILRITFSTINNVLTCLFKCWLSKEM